MDKEALDEMTFTFGDKKVTGKKILEKFKPEHVVVYTIDDEEILTFCNMGTDIEDIQKEFPDWTPNPGNNRKVFLMYKNNILCVAGLEDYCDKLDFYSDIPITPYMNLGIHTPDEYVDFWKSNKEIHQNDT